MKRPLLFFLLLSFSVPLFPAVFNPYLNQIRQVYEGKIDMNVGQKNSVLSSLAFGTALPSEIIVFGKGDASALLKYGGKIQTRIASYFTALLPVSSLSFVESESAIDFLNYEPPVQKYMDQAHPFVSANQSYAAGYKGDDVIIGVVDTGIDVNHLDFKTENGLSRILNIWDQNASGTYPYGFDYGAEYSKYDIDAGNCPEFDEGILHGTHVTGIAAGNGNRSGGLYKGISPRANIIFVKLNFNSMVYVIDAINYIFFKAAQQKRPCVINLSLGNQSGSHTEYDDFNQAMDAVVDHYGRNGNILVWAAGNDGGVQVHIQTNAMSGAFTTVRANYSSSPMNIVFWYTNSSQTFRIRNQVGTTVINYTSTSGFTTLSGAGVDVQSGANGSGEKYLYVSIRGSAGTWSIDFTNDSTAGKIDGYVLNTSSGLLTDYSSFGTLTGQASQKLAISVGAIVTRTTYNDILGFPHPSGETLSNIATFSSRGPTRDGKNKPDISAPGSLIISTYAISPGYVLPSSEKISEYYVVKQGTSMAAPVVTGIIAQLLEKETNLSVADIQQKFMNYSKIYAADYKTSRTWDNAFGYGIADLAFLTAVNAAVARLDVSLKNNVMNVSQAKDNQLYILFRSNSTQVGKTVRAAIYDRNGGLIRDFGSTLVNQIAVKEYVWNGKDQFSRTVRPGLYFVQVTLGSDTSRYPVLVVR